MAFKINEKKMVNDSTFQFEDRLKSPTIRFGETTPVFTTYYHINSTFTTTDEGFQDIASFLGNQSPLRFDKIEEFPLYDLEQVVLQLSDSESGLDSNFESEAKIMPGTIRPYPNDIFIIPTLRHDAYVFRVTNITYDSVIQNSFYKIEFRLEWIDSEKENWLEKQTVSNNICILENIGTDTNCIIEAGVYNKINTLKGYYDNIKDIFKTMFYNERHNVMTVEFEPHTEWYDSYMGEFINRNNLLNDKNDLYTILLTNQCLSDPRYKIKYTKTIFNFIEKRDKNLIRDFRYHLRPGVTVPGSSFATWADRRIKVTDIHNYEVKSISIFQQEFYDAIINNKLGDSETVNLIVKYINDDTLNINVINEKIVSEILYMDNGIEQYYTIPIILYIMKFIVKKTLKK